ncbi:hypothetical protein M3650_14460 [Paenibacillus sp. MER TA 81-3]|uniref:hypothetical protein n=1 Tax=Paenibacillus sp. MER TA 81-3 TaxID=2939573 RepID=UPI00203E2C4E|nr:hypothetical protein [Paenibacillus sp. MER TA 81-3]MCM3339798.1 hypothetical protein [Paenibacillus sp. MER TA 81-3]
MNGQADQPWSEWTVTQAGAIRRAQKQHESIVSSRLSLKAAIKPGTASAPAADNPYAAIRDTGM